MKLHLNSYKHYKEDQLPDLTPPHVCHYMAEIAVEFISYYQEKYSDTYANIGDLTAGDGRLLDYFLDQYSIHGAEGLFGSVYSAEYNYERAKPLMKRRDITFLNCDFFEAIHVVKNYSLLLANYPIHQDLCLHMIEASLPILVPGGMLLCAIPVDIMLNPNTPYRERFNEFLDHYDGTQWNVCTYPTPSVGDSCDPHECRKQLMIFSVEKCAGAQVFTSKVIKR